MKTESGRSDPVRGCERCGGVPADGLPPFELVRPLWDSSHSSFDLCHCRGCGQPILKQFHEILDPMGEDDHIWTRWTPLTSEEAAELQAACPGVTSRPRVAWNWLAAFARRRGRLVRDPRGRLFWSDRPIDPCDLAAPG